MGSFCEASLAAITVFKSGLPVEVLEKSRGCQEYPELVME